MYPSSYFTLNQQKFLTKFNLSFLTHTWGLKVPEIFLQKNLGVFFRVSTTMARMNLVGLLLATAALGSCFLSAVPTQTPRAPAPKQVESLGAPQMENQKSESCWELRKTRWISCWCWAWGKVIRIIVDVWKEGGLQIQFMCWMGPLLLDTGTANDVLFDGLFQKQNTIWWQWNIHWFGNKQIKYPRSSDTFPYSLHGDAPGTNTDWWWFRLHQWQYILALQLFFCCSPFSPFHKNKWTSNFHQHSFLPQKASLGLLLCWASVLLLASSSAWQQCNQRRPLPLNSSVSWPMHRCGGWVERGGELG